MAKEKKAAGRKSPAKRARVGQPTADWAQSVVFTPREAKQAVSLRLDANVLRFFRNLGSGYQTRINEVLRVFMEAHQAANPRVVHGNNCPNLDFPAAPA